MNVMNVGDFNGRRLDLGRL